MPDGQVIAELPKLKPKQERFVQEYCVSFNAADAARKAGYSARTAHVIGHENLRKPNIAAAIRQRQAQLAENAELSEQMVIRNLKRVAGKAEDAEQFGAAVRSHELLGKHINMFDDRANMAFQFNVSIGGNDGETL